MSAVPSIPFQTAAIVSRVSNGNKVVWPSLRPSNRKLEFSGILCKRSALKIKRIMQSAQRNWKTRSVTEEREVNISDSDLRDLQKNKVEGFNNEGRLSLETAGAQMQIRSGSQGSQKDETEREKEMKYMDRVINATMVFAAGAFVIAKMLTVDHDYWHGWTLYEIVRYAPLHNWTAYEEALKTNPVLAKMVISGVVYSVGDWIAQCFEGKPIFEFNRQRVFRSGLVGFCLHGSLSHYYYHLCEDLFPFQDWWLVPVKVAFDQTVWATVWNSIYYVVLGFFRLESPTNIFNELRATFWPLLTAGWKLWPFAHLITYGVVPVEQRLLWVDCIELIWVTILSMYSNEKTEARTLEASEGKSSNSSKA
eukprot:TRINITY_DN569_c0_g1_i1.p1 TRINITY_DN569_c0_g1~~TRINITY_DN569_c0_g1_i1.p1  ORF type:complete len:364 (-),score=69.17 TRINITY_DN569_c0_g1_i1:428-1519(-)